MDRKREWRVGHDGRLHGVLCLAGDTESFCARPVTSSDALAEPAAFLAGGCPVCPDCLMVAAEANRHAA